MDGYPPNDGGIQGLARWSTPDIDREDDEVLVPNTDPPQTEGGEKWEAPSPFLAGLTPKSITNRLRGFRRVSPTTQPIYHRCHRHRNYVGSLRGIRSGQQRTCLPTATLRVSGIPRYRVLQQVGEVIISYIPLLDSTSRHYSC
jgi:hypothetical protein